MTTERLQRLHRVLDQRQPDLTVFLDTVHKSHNLSAIIRSCDAVGVHQVHAVWPKHRVRPSNGVSGGSRKWVLIKKHEHVGLGIDEIKAQGFEVLAAHQSDRAEDFRAVDYTRPVCLLMGTELFGVSAEAAEKADRHVVIPMQGMVESLNVSVAAATILFEVQRQRLEAGMYDRRCLDEETCERLIFEWMQPKIARYCRHKDLPYPQLDEDGDVVDFSVNKELGL